MLLVLSVFIYYIGWFVSSLFLHVFMYVCRPLVISSGVFLFPLLRVLFR